MEKDENIELRDEEIYPEDEVLQAVLDSTYLAYAQLLELFDSNDLTYEWRYYKDGKAWLCKVQKKDKTITWMSAWSGFLKAAIYIPVRIVDNLYELDIEEGLKDQFKSAKNIGKSKPCVFEIRDSDILCDFEKVMKFKIKSR